MKKLIAALCLGAMACTAATTASAQYSAPATPVEALFGALLGAPSNVRRMPRRQMRQVRRAPRYRQGYVRNWGFDQRLSYQPQALPARATPARRANTRRKAAVAPAKALDGRFLRQTVAYNGEHAPGTIVVDTTQRFLYFVNDDGTALRYGIGVGRSGFEWSGTSNVKRKAEWPAWHPPAEMREREPWLPTRMEGGEGNPLGARAMYLFKGQKDTLYRIHGTNQPHTIGQAVSSGCIRMLNDDVADLYERVPLGTKVVVI